VGQRFLLDIAPTGVEHYCEIDHDGDELTLIEHTPTRIEDEILDHCAKLRGMAQGRGNAFQHAATIPINTYQAWKKEWREHWADKFTWSTFEVMKLNSRDNCKLRTGHQRGVYGKLL
jgi:hypothetical protein